MGRPMMTKAQCYQVLRAMPKMSQFSGCYLRKLIRDNFKYFGIEYFAEPHIKYDTWRAHYSFLKVSSPYRVSVRRAITIGDAVSRWFCYSLDPYWIAKLADFECHGCSRAICSDFAPDNGEPFCADCYATEKVRVEELRLLLIETKRLAEEIIKVSKEMENGNINRDDDLYSRGLDQRLKLAALGKPKAVRRKDASVCSKANHRYSEDRGGGREHALGQFRTDPPADLSSGQPDMERAA